MRLMKKRRYLRMNDLYLKNPASRREARRAEKRTRHEEQKLTCRERARAHLSVLYLFLRASGAWVAGICAGLAAVECGLWAVMMHRAAGADAYNRTAGYTVCEEAWNAMGLPFLFAIATLAVVLLLPLRLSRGQSQVTYTLGRLSVKESTVFVWMALYTAGCLLLLAAVQVVVAFGLGLWHADVLGGLVPGATPGQSVLLAFYRHDLLHSLLPLSDGTRWIASGLLTVALAMSSAHMYFTSLYKKHSYLSLSMIAIPVIFALFALDMGLPGQDILVIAPLSLFCVGWILSKWLRKGGARDDAQESPEA